MLGFSIFAIWAIGTVPSYLWIRKCNPELPTLEKDCIGQRTITRDPDGRIPKGDALGIALTWPFTIVFREGGYRVLCLVGRAIVWFFESLLRRLP